MYFTFNIYVVFVLTIVDIYVYGIWKWKFKHNKIVGTCVSSKISMNIIIRKKINFTKFTVFKIPYVR